MVAHPSLHATQKLSWADLLNRDSTALLVLDVQNDFCHPDGEIGLLGHSLDQVEPFIIHLKRLIASTRNYGVPIFFTLDVHDENTDSQIWLEKHTHDGRSPYPRKGTWGAQFFFPICPKLDDQIVVKHRYSAFIGTELNNVLRERNTTTLIVAGLYTHVCVESTVRHAHMLDYRIVVPEECVMRGSRSEDTDIHKNSLAVMSDYFAYVVPLDHILNFWSVNTSVS